MQDRYYFIIIKYYQKREKIVGKRSGVADDKLE